jgi:hypothetical protein
LTGLTLELLVQSPLDFGLRAFREPLML